MIGAPDHDKDIVDGINESDKRYLKGKMCMIGTPEVDNCSKRIKAHSMIGNAHYSFVQEFKRLCECNERDNGAKCYSNYKKGEAEYKIKQRFYYVQNKNDVMMTSLKKVIGMKSDKLMGISAMYNFRSDPDMSIGKIAIRTIPCTCNSCLEQLNSV